MPDIRIVRTPGGAVQPEGSRTTVHRTGETVRFTTEPDAQGLRISFDNESPFGPANRVVHYGVPLHVTAVFNESDPSRNHYPYTCEIMVNGQTLKSQPASGSGGEMEVIRTN